MRNKSTFVPPTLKALTKSKFKFSFSLVTGSPYVQYENFIVMSLMDASIFNNKFAFNDDTEAILRTFEKFELIHDTEV